MGDMQAAARLTMATKLIGDVVGEETTTSKVAARDLMQQGGVERVRVTDAAGNNLGTVTLAAGRKTAKVVDRQAFIRWVAGKYPTETVTAVNEAFEKKLLDAAKKADDPVDTSDGELIPGVEISDGDPYIQVRPTDDARDRMRTMLANSGLLALASGTSEEAGDAA